MPTVRGHGSRYVGSGAPSSRAAGKWKKHAPMNGEVVQHPTTGKWVARMAMQTDSHHDTKEAAEAHLQGHRDAIAKYKKFSEM